MFYWKLYRNWNNWSKILTNSYQNKKEINMVFASWTARIQWNKIHFIYLFLLQNRKSIVRKCICYLWSPSKLYIPIFQCWIVVCCSFMAKEDFNMHPCAISYCVLPQSGSMCVITQNAEERLRPGLISSK